MTRPDQEGSLERRHHRRLAIRLPLECWSDQARERPLRTVTSNVSTGGLYFEVDLIDGVAVPDLRDRLNIELTVPPGDGHFPYAGRMSTAAEVTRCEPLGSNNGHGPVSVPRVGVAARFCETLKLAF